MDVSAVRNQATAVRSDLLSRTRSPCLAEPVTRGRTRTGTCLPRTCRAVPNLTAARRPSKISAVKPDTKSQVARGIRDSVIHTPELFVGLPLDVVSDCNNINHAKAISAGLKALKLLGIDGVELPIWWGIVEKESMGKYEWTSYLALANMIHDAGLRVRASIYFHASNSPMIPLPSWVSTIGEENPDMFFTNKDGKRNKECLSHAVDELPIFGSKTPVQVFEDFCHSFQDAFSEFMGSTIKVVRHVMRFFQLPGFFDHHCSRFHVFQDISIGLGPGGELRYPSLPMVKSGKFSGIGEFQCYDKHMLNHLKVHAEQTGNPMWGLSGPHDVPRPDQTPDSGPFFKEQGGSWSTPYGKFFLAWYSEQLLSHGERILSSASAVFGSSPGIVLSAKIPFMHSWYKTRSHASELTAGYYNTDERDGYDAVAELFAKHRCRMTLAGMDLSDEHEYQAARCGPESLLAQILQSCKKHHVNVTGENHSVSGVTDSFARIKKSIQSAGSSMDSFTYQRMGAYFFSPEHWPKFTAFIRGIDKPELHADDIVLGERSLSLSADVLIGSKQSSRQMQAV